MIVFSRETFCETSNSLFHGDQLAGMACEYLGDLERLRKETLDLTCTCYGKLVFFRQLVHTQNSNNILKGLVILQDLLDSTSNFVMFLANNVRVHDTRSGIKGISSRIDTQFGNGSGQHSGGVQVSECGGGSRISQVISRYIIACTDVMDPFLVVVIRSCM